MLRTFVAVLACSVFLGACEKPPDPVKTERAIAWLKEHYAKFPIGGGWRVTSVKASGADINVAVRVTEEQRLAIANLPPENQFKMVALAGCPGALEPIWSILDPNHRLMLLASGADGIFIDIDCRMWRI